MVTLGQKVLKQNFESSLLPSVLYLYNRSRPHIFYPHPVFPNSAQVFIQAHSPNKKQEQTLFKDLRRQDIERKNDEPKK